jgi:hypothetical protein
VGILSGARPGGLSGWRAYLMTGLLSDGGLAFWQAGLLSGRRAFWLAGRACFLTAGLLSDGGLAFWLAGFLAGGLSGWRAFWMHSVMEVLCNIERKRITISIIIGIYSGS